jgi:hypothetical protein
VDSSRAHTGTPSESLAQDAGDWPLTLVLRAYEWTGDAVCRALFSAAERNGYGGMLQRPLKACGSGPPREHSDVQELGQESRSPGVQESCSLGCSLGSLTCQRRERPPMRAGKRGRLTVQRAVRLCCLKIWGRWGPGSSPLPGFG